MGRGSVPPRTPGSNYRLIVRPPAERDLREAQQWYEEQRPGLGADFRAAIDNSFRRLAENPQLYPVVYRGLRRAVMRRFPYLIYFAVQKDVVNIVACWHSKRDPNQMRWRVR